MSNEPRVKIFYNKNLGMSPGKVAAQAVHAALQLFGVHPDYPVVVLAANKGRVEDQESVIIDEGRTEIAPGSTTAGASFEFPVGYTELEILHERYRRAEAAMVSARNLYNVAYVRYATFDAETEVV